MNYTKIQQDIVREWGKNTTTAAVSSYRDDIFYIDTDSTRLFIVPKALCVLSFDQLVKKFRLVDAPRVLKYHIRSAQTDGRLSGIQKTRTNGKLAAEIVGGPESVWVDPKLLAAFGKDVRLRVGGRLNGVLIYEGETLVGLLMPVNMKKEATE